MDRNSKVTAKRTPKTPAERQAKHKRKLESFGIKKIGYKASATERRLLLRIKQEGKFDSREHVIGEAIRLLGEEYGLTLSQMKREMDEQERRD